MSELNFNRKIFLELEELNRFQEFLKDDTVTNAILGNTSQWGIIQTEFDTEDLNFKVSLGTSAGTIQIAKETSQAIDIDGNLIRQFAEDNIATTDDNQWYWLSIEYIERRYEVGTVSINTDGEVTGTGTLLTEVLRGQATDAPIKVKFEQLDGSPALNNSIYEIVSVTDDTNAILTTYATFIAESDLRMIVIGTTPIGSIVSTEQEEGIYKYDSCLLNFTLETVVDTPPTLPAQDIDRVFFVARVRNNASVLTIQDKRDLEDTYWKFNVPGLEGAIITKPLPIPPGTDQYLYLGSLPNDVTGYARFFFQGCQPNGGPVFDLLVQNIVIPPSTLIQDVGNRVFFGGAGSIAQRPLFIHYNNTSTDRLDVYVKSADTDGGFVFLPGYISFVGETIDGGVDGWIYADSFTWSAVAPPAGSETNPTLYNAYGDTSIITDLNTQLAGLNAAIAAIENNTSWASSDIAETRSNLDVLSSGEIENLINADVGELVYSARVYETSNGVTDTANITIFKNVDNFISSVDTSSEYYLFNFTVTDAAWQDKYEVQVTSNTTSDSATGANRNPQVRPQSTPANGIAIFFADSSGNRALSRSWIRIYKWID